MDCFGSSHDTHMNYRADSVCTTTKNLLSETPVSSFLMSCLFDPLLSLLKSQTIHAAPLQTSPQYGGALRGRGDGEGEGSTEEPCTSENLEELGLKAMEILGGKERGVKKE